MPSLSELRERDYAGRVCLIARTLTGGVRVVYVLTGRSDASRQRALQLGSDSVEVVDTRPGGAHDMLRHYDAAIRRGPWLVVGNGDHVEPLADALHGTGGSGKAVIQSAWEQHNYEPDPPIYTPRIWVAVHQRETGKQELWAGSVVRAENGHPAHRLWSVDELAPGTAAMLTTYVGPIQAPQPSGELTRIEFDSQDGPILEQVWAVLDPMLRVAGIELDPERAMDSARQVSSKA